ncbi:hypothetical protein OSB04_006792 [Centaurea solstitialis]|uniref:Retrotransposon protein, putative, Ty1-copia subclass n=1 Tax=Centaurea solstitialis TaxID=347529 RepID=A0AA38WI01_9ASTR|nr:hypothetical protein OSB04_006792 [Centaurea solstitialis]
MTTVANTAIATACRRNNNRHHHHSVVWPVLAGNNKQPPPPPGEAVRQPAVGSVVRGSTGDNGQGRRHLHATAATTGQQQRHHHRTTTGSIDAKQSLLPPPPQSVVWRSFWRTTAAVVFATTTAASCGPVPRTTNTATTVSGGTAGFAAAIQSPPHDRHRLGGRSRLLIYRNRSKRLIGLSQSTYIDKVLKRFRMDESKKGFIPMQHGIVLSKTQCPVSSEDQDRMKSVPYASAIGSIMYAMLCTRPDVAYSVSVTSRYQQNPGEPHWVAVKNILKYLRRTKEMFLVFGGSEDEISVTGYSDASFQTDRDDFRSQSGYVFTLNGGAISWKSSKQDTIADSTTEAEYIAACDAAKEAVWLRNFLSDLRVVASISRPIDIFCDNSGAVAQAKEPREHHKSRHVLRKYHLIREIIGRGDVRICKIPTEDNVADPLTKPLARAKHEAHANSIGMQYLEARLDPRLGIGFSLSAVHVLVSLDSQQSSPAIIFTATTNVVS